MPIFREYHWFDPSGESTFLLGEARRNGLDASYRTLRDCALRGRISPLTGETVHLRVCRLTGGIGTTIEEYHRFIRAMNRSDE